MAMVTLVGFTGALLVSLVGGGQRWRQLGQADTASAGDLRVWLLQGNIPQDQKFEPGTGVAEALAWYPRQMLEGVAAAAGGQGPQLVVAPETALPLLPDQLGTAFWQPLLQPVADQAGGAAAAIFAAGTNVAPVLVPSLAAKAESPSPSKLLPPASSGLTL